MKMSFVKIIFDKFSPRGVNDIFTDVITRTKTAIIDVDGHYDLGRAQLRKLFEKVPGGNIKRLQLNNVHFPLIIATSINSRVFLVPCILDPEVLKEIFMEMSKQTKLKSLSCSFREKLFLDNIPPLQRQ